MQILRSLKTFVLAGGVLCAFGARASCDVMTVEPGSLTWTTVHTRVVPLSVDWPDGATSATLTTTDLYRRGRTARRRRFGVER